MFSEAHFLRKFGIVITSTATSLRTNSNPNGLDWSLPTKIQTISDMSKFNPFERLIIGSLKKFWKTPKVTPLRGLHMKSLFSVPELQSSSQTPIRVSKQNQYLPPPPPPWWSFAHFWLNGKKKKFGHFTSQLRHRVEFRKLVDMSSGWMFSSWDTSNFIKADQQIPDSFCIILSYWKAIRENKSSKNHLQFVWFDKFEPNELTQWNYRPFVPQKCQLFTSNT